jgi:hypothetical protein
MSVEKEEIVCKNCGLINDFRTEEVVFANGTEHTEAFCNGCDKHLKYISKGLPSKFHFGKHAGMLVSDCVDVSYMQFMIDKADINKRFRRELELRIEQIKKEVQETPGENNNQNNNTMDITGILKVKEEAQQVSDKFRKREFVLTDNSSQYPQHISFQLTQDKCNLIDAIAVGSEIKVHFNLRGREWTSPKGEVKYFNTLEAWRIEVVQNLQVDTGNTGQSNPGPAQEDDLPF